MIPSTIWSKFLFHSIIKNNTITTLYEVEAFKSFGEPNYLHFVGILKRRCYNADLNKFNLMSSNKILRCLSNLLKKMDLFPADQFIRFRGESEYTTATGGFFSFLLLGTILAAFLSKGFQTVNRENITSSSTTNIEYDP